ncbi:MAG: alpha/beta hydrolase [Bacteroidales bacterium]|nr:alpha/beta hydrolase [Bacteroidales bacterium]MDE7073132.1 alpha/beta hydrolase [Bacteroidales bacterium]
MLHKYLEIDTHRLHYTIRKSETGTGIKPVVLLHGFTEAVFVWDELAGYLSELGYFVICVDLAGHGQSDCFAEVHTMELQAELVNRVLEAESVSEAVVIGHSMGGYVAAAFAALYPRKVKGLGFYHSHPAADEPQAKENRRRSLQILRAGKISFILDTTADLFAPGTSAGYQPQIAALQESAGNMGAAAIAAAQAGMMERPSRLEVLQLPVPIMFIIGKRDNRINPAKIMAQTLIPEHCHVLTLPIGHMGFYERKSETEAFIRGYLQAICW